MFRVGTFRTKLILVVEYSPFWSEVILKAPSDPSLVGYFNMGKLSLDLLFRNLEKHTFRMSGDLPICKPAPRRKVISVHTQQRTFISLCSKRPILGRESARSLLLHLIDRELQSEESLLRDVSVGDLRNFSERI